MENKKYFVPEVNIKHLLLDEHGYKEAEAQVCELVLNMYDLSFSCLHGFLFEEHSYDNHVIKDLRVIKNICKAIIKFEVKNYNLVKMVNDR